MPSISAQSLFSNVTKEFSVRRNEATDPKKFTQTVLQISDQQSRDKDYEKSLQYIRTYISSLQAKLNAVVEDLNNTYESMLNDVMFKRADTKNTAKLLNRIPDADVDTCAAASIGDPNALDITPYSKNIHNYQYNQLFASKGLDMSNYSDLGSSNDVATARGYYENLGGTHHELGSSVFGTLNYLWMWDVDRINASYATTMKEFVDQGGILHVPPGDSRLDPTNTNIVADSQLAFAAGSDPNSLQVNVTALQPNRGVFKPESEDLHVEKKVLLTLDGEPTDDNPNPLGGWITTYDHSGSNKRGPGLGTPWEGLNQWGIDTDDAGGYVLNGTGSLHFGNNIAYQTHDLDLVNGGFKVTSTINTQAGYLFEPELVREDFNGETTASLATQGWNMGDLTQVSITAPSASGGGGDAVSGSVLDIHYTGGVNGPGGSTTVSTPSFNLSEFDSTQLSSQSYYDVRGTLHGNGCIHPSCVVQISAGGTTNTQLPNTPGSNQWVSTGNQFATFNTNPTGAGSTSIDFNLVQQYADNNANGTHWQIDDVFLKAKGWSKGEMISPAMDFTGFDNAYVDYWDKIQTDASTDRKEVYYSADYNDVTGTGTWILLNSATGIADRPWTNNKIEIPVGCLADPSKVRIKFAFDTVNSQTNANLKGWNIDDVQVYGDKPEKTDFYYYRQGLDSYFVAGDGTSPTPPIDITGSTLTSWSSGAGSPSLTFNSGAVSFNSTTFSNVATPVPPVTISMSVTAEDTPDTNATVLSSNSFKVSATANVTPTPFSTDADAFIEDLTPMDLSNAATATLTFTHSGQMADSSVLGNHRKVQYDIGFGWTDLPIGASFDEQSFASTPVSISLPVGNANTKIRFVSEIATVDTDATNYWNVSNIAVSTTPSAGTVKSISREAVSNTINSSAYPGAKMSFDFTANTPLNATNVKRELLISTDGGFNYSSIGTYTGASGTITGVSVPRSTSLKYKFVTSYDVPANTTVNATSGIWDINNLKVESSATDGFNVKEGYDTTTGQISYNINRPNISFDSRETNIEGRYKLPGGAGPIDGRTTITNSDMPMFTNALLSYIEQDAGVYNRAKFDTSAVWQGVTNVFPAEVIDLLKQKKGNYTNNYVTNNLNQLLTYDDAGNEAAQYMDDALAINYGFLTKAPTLADINKNDTGWVNYSTANNFFPYVAGTRYAEGAGYKNMSIWGKKSFILNSTPPASPNNITMSSDDDSYMYVNGFVVPPTGWVSWYNTTYQSWYNTTYTSWYNTNIKPYLAGNPPVTPFNGNPYDPLRNPYDSSPPKVLFELAPAAPTPPAIVAPLAPPLYSNVGSATYDVSPFIKKGFNTIAFKATEDNGAESVVVNGSIAGVNISTDSTWAVKIQPSGYDGVLNTNGTNPPAKRLNSAQIIELFQTDKKDKEKLDVNFSNLDKNGVGILSRVVSADVTVRGESTVQTFGTTTYSTKTRTTDGKMVAQLNNGFINGQSQTGGEGSAIFDPTAQNPATGLPIPDTGLNFTTDIDGKADISLFFDKTKDIVNDATVLVKVEYYEDSNQDGILDATETSAVNLKTKYVGMQDRRDNTAINPDSDAADASLSGQGVLERYAKDAAGNLLYNTNGNYANAIYDNYLVAGKGRTGGANVEGNQNKLTNRLKQLIDSPDFQEVLKYGLLDNIYLAATVSDSRGDQMTGKLLIDWDWHKRRASITQLAYSAGYKA